MTKDDTPDDLREQCINAEVTESDIAEVQYQISALEVRGVTVDGVCGKCGEPTEHRVLPEERDDEPQVTICRSCATRHLQMKGLL